jgi:GEVED domain
MNPVQSSSRVSVLTGAAVMVVAGLAGQASAQYCTPSSHYDYYEYIRDFNVGGLSHSITAPPTGGYLDATSNTTDLNRGQNYEVHVNIGNNYAGDRCALFVDWDHSGAFEPSEMTTLGANLGPYTATLAIPATALVGPTRMRVRVTWQEAVDPCNQSNYGSTTDYTVNIVAPVSAPPSCTLSFSPNTGLIGQTFTATAQVVPGVGPGSTGLAVSLDASAINSGTVTLYDDGTHGDATAGDHLFTNNAVPVGAATADGPHTLTATVSDAQGRSSTDNETFTSGYCGVQITSVVICDSFYEYIQNVQFGSINNSSNCDSGLYEDYSAISTDLTAGVPTPITIGIANPYTGDKVKIWADWNNNASFEASEEFTVTPYPAPQGGAPVVTATITAPVGTAPGPKRMRIRLGWGSADPIPCGTSLYGNVEDYTVNVVTGTSCDTADYDCDGDVGTDADIEAFFACLAGTCPQPPCTSSADFNHDGDTGTDADIEAFFRVLGGGPC